MINLAAAVKESDNIAVVQRLSIASGASAEKTSPNSSVWQPICKQALEADSTAKLLYCPTHPDLLFYSQDSQYFLIRTDLSHWRKILFDGVQSQPDSPKGFACSSVAFSDDGTQLAVGLRSGKLALWQVETQSAGAASTTVSTARDNAEQETDKGSLSTRPWLRSIPLAAHPSHNEEVFGVSFSPDGKYLVSASRDRLVQIYDITAQQLAAPAIVHHGTVNAARVTNDSRFVTAIARDIVFVWTFPTTRSLPKTFGIPYGRTIEASALSPSGYMAVGGRRSSGSNQSGWMRLVNVLDGRQIMEELALPSPVKHLAIHPGGQWIFAVDTSGNALLYNVPSSKTVWSKGSQVVLPGLESSTTI